MHLRNQTPAEKRLGPLRIEAPCHQGSNLRAPSSASRNPHISPLESSSRIKLPRGNGLVSFEHLARPQAPVWNTIKTTGPDSVHFTHPAAPNRCLWSCLTWLRILRPGETPTACSSGAPQRDHTLRLGARQKPECTRSAPVVLASVPEWDLWTPPKNLRPRDLGRCETRVFEGIARKTTSPDSVHPDEPNAPDRGLWTRGRSKSAPVDSWAFRNGTRGLGKCFYRRLWTRGRFRSASANLRRGGGTWRHGHIAHVSVFLSGIIWL